MQRAFAALAAGIIAACAYSTGALAASGAWKPEKAVEIVAPSGAGGTTDRTARVVARILTQHKLVDVPVNVVNKPGGSGTIGLNYLNQHAGDAHYIIIATTGSISNHILGLIPYNHTNFTPLAMLFDEYLAVNTRADSPIASGRDLIDRLRKDPQSASLGISTSIGGGNHTTLMLALKAGGLDVKRVKTAVFQGGAATTTALLGGHVDVINTAPGNMVAHFRSGKLRPLAVSAPQRLGGVFSTVPTWREQGVNAVNSSWRGLMGPRGLMPEQIAYWDRVFAALVKTDEWKKDLQDNFWDEGYLDARAARKRLDDEYAEYKTILTELGVSK
ncbi:MAG: tripartite tricarboxylate transporter substrate binding protein [Burkholderiales bacterium]